MQRLNALVGPTELFIVPQADAHVIDYLWNKKIVAAQLDKRADNLKIEVAKMIARANLRRQS